ncbi:MAG: galactose-1-phosphate uridylyltransferase [Elusimicrobia bacterium GWA2_56_46]|nr:MAG: galactose-1-phosphate uridylyltransferase [Elusimicrobia bacterium GWA2_56_46]OGR56125.1 MAG: galactose-1-phosphate uridylyltransferase [Elusimicrobia bacterium GWC2_56_31]HBW23103.1 galactose-1-phosphate uridylyltransferase [Elusimicrobiota bacterium]
MPEIRKDPVFGRWVIIASGRRLRPNEFRGVSAPENPRNCPFCPGHEEETPPSVYTLYGKGAKGQGLNACAGDQTGKKQDWRLRVVLNKYPALVSGGSAARAADGIYERMEGIGIHEVVIETPDHNRQLEDMSVPEIADIFRTFILRVNELKKDPRIKYVMIFKNFGRNAGASLAHPHSQIVAMPMTPIRVAQEIAGAKKYREDRGVCVFCDILRQETRYKKRVVGETGNFLAVTPYASRFTFETWIIPKKHQSHFERMAPGLAADLAGIVKNTVGKLRASVEELSYNLIVHTMPLRDRAAGHYHWHIEIMPKLSRAAGFEWGTGFYINTVSPEDAAEMMNKGKKYKV